MSVIDDKLRNMLLNFFMLPVLPINANSVYLDSRPFYQYAVIYVGCSNITETFAVGSKRIDTQ